MQLSGNVEQSGYKLVKQEDEHIALLEVRGTEKCIALIMVLRAIKNMQVRNMSI